MLDLEIARGPRSYEPAVRAIDAGFRYRAGDRARTSQLCGRLKLDLEIARGPRSYEPAVRVIDAGSKDRAGTALVGASCAGD